MSKDRDDQIYERQLPNKVKPQEKERINLAYTNITKNFQESNKKFTPIEGVPYLWVYTENKEIIVGIEEPWKYPQAFIDPSDPKQVKYFNEILKPQLEQSGMLGHPTLASAFDKNEGGTAVPEMGKAFIGGELKFVDGKWHLDNYSGRFGLLRNDPEDVQFLMNQVANQFNEAMDIKPTFSITLPQASHLTAYNKIWKSGSNEVESAMKLLKDYTKSGGFDLFITAHWNRKNVELVKGALAEFKKNPELTVKDILDYFSKNLPERTNLDGSLIKRLKYIAGQTNNEFTLGEKLTVTPPKIKA